MEVDVVKEQLKVFKKASNGENIAAFDDALNVLSDFFEIPRAHSEISKR